jgi:hypothetical protein
MADKTTKVLLGFIVLGIWLNLAIQFRPTGPKRAYESQLSMANRQLSEIQSVLSDTKDDIDQLQEDVDSIANSGCANGTICR